jgi:hypothetical protein
MRGFWDLLGMDTELQAACHVTTEQTDGFDGDVVAGDHIFWTFVNRQYNETFSLPDFPINPNQCLADNTPPPTTTPLA